MQLGWPLPRRADMLAELQAITEGPTYRLVFQGKQLDLPIYRVPLEMPKYRLENGRTQDLQLEYIAERHAPPDFFKRDSESEEAQEAQHSLLLKLVNERELLDYFKRHKQTEPFVLDSKGFVVNGNRRLCAMRELLDQDPLKFAHFGHIDVVALPPAPPEDVLDLEVRLQVHQDIRAGYRWTATALMMREAESTRRYRDEKALADLFDTTPKILRRYGEMLDLADEYLTSRKKPSQYSLVASKEFAFQKLVEARKTVRADYTKVFNDLAFALIDDPIGERLYKSIPDLAKNIDKVAKELMGAGEPQDDRVAGESTESNSDLDLLGGDSVEGRTTTDGGSDYRVPTSEAELKKVRSTVRDALLIQRDLQREEQRSEFAVSQVRKAAALIEQAIAALNANSTLEGLIPELSDLRAKIDNLESAAAKL